MKKQYRQGDVALIAVTKLPEGVRMDRRERGIIVLAHGEATGHAHVIQDAPEGTEYVEIGGELFLVLQESAELVHGRLDGMGVIPLDSPDHGTITIPPGIYKVPGQREYVHHAVRQVVD